MMRKGISPLIAAVLLIAFTMAVAAILTAWITNLAESESETVGNKSQQVVQCSFADMALFDAVWDDSANNVTVSIANTGTVNLNEVRIFVYVDGEQIKATSGSIASADIQTVDVSGISSKPNQVLIRSVDCPKLTDQQNSVSVQ